MNTRTPVISGPWPMKTVLSDLVWISPCRNKFSDGFKTRIFEFKSFNFQNLNCCPNIKQCRMSLFFISNPVRNIICPKFSQFTTVNRDSPTEIDPCRVRVNWIPTVRSVDQTVRQSLAFRSKICFHWYESITEKLTSVFEITKKTKSNHATNNNGCIKTKTIVANQNWVLKLFQPNNEFLEYSFWLFYIEMFYTTDQKISKENTCKLVFAANNMGNKSAARDLSATQKTT